MSRIPEARQIVDEVAKMLPSSMSYERSRLQTAVRLMERTSVKRPPVLNPELRHVDTELAGEIREYAAEHDELSQAKIAAHFKVGQGRVSEALNFHR